MPSYYTWPEDGHYLVMCITTPGWPHHWPHAFLLTADTAEHAAAMGRYRYQILTGAESAGITVRVTAAADLPEIMFGEEKVA